jgi:Peptidase family M41
MSPVITPGCGGYRRYGHGRSSRTALGLADAGSQLGLAAQRMSADRTDGVREIRLTAIRGGVPRRKLTSGERRPLAHGMLTPGADPVRKVSIIPRGQALGVTLSTPDSDRVSYSRDELDHTKRVRSVHAQVTELFQ